VTNPDSPVGAFANRNHFAGLLYAALPLLAAYLASTRSPRGSTPPWAVLSGAALFLLILACVGLTGSRAGLLLVVPAALGAGALWLLSSSPRRGRAGRRWAGGGLVVAMLLGLIVLPQLTARLKIDGWTDVRREELWSVTSRAARAHQPVGSGPGTFVPIYQRFERWEAMPNVPANHAHNDWLELWLEGGVPVLLVLCAFLLWFGVTTGRLLWRRPAGEHDAEWRLFGIAGALTALLLMLHSMVDYPLRTEALTSVFAFSCALLVRPRRARERRPRSGGASVLVREPSVEHQHDP